LAQTGILIKNPGKNMPGRSLTQETASKSPPHRAWVNTVIARQAVLLALDLRSLTPSQDFHPSGIFMSSLPITVAGPRRHHTGLPY
jgi:hypothetical protein